MEAASTAPVDHLFADLSTPAPSERRLFTQDIQGLDFLRSSPGVTAHEKSIITEIIELRKSMLQSELAAANPFLNARIAKEVHHQLRSRPDFQTGKLVVEQWVPAFNYWLISAIFDLHTDANVIIATLQESDPRIKNATERYAENQEAALAAQAHNDQAGNDRVASVIDNMSRTQVANFLEVERAIKSGETIIAHGADEHFLESAHHQTLTAAAAGDHESRHVLTSGAQADTDACVNPGHNPIIR